MIKGIVTSGLGKGAFYIQKYAKYLPLTSFPGTLNIKSSYQLPKGKTISPKEVDLHPIDIYPILINNTYKGIIVKPHKTQHNNILEIVAEINLRETLQLQDGDEITCELV